VAAVPGTFLPYAFFGPLVLENGPNLSLFLSQLFQNRISAFFGMDLLVSAVALWEGRRLGMRNLWIYILCALLVGVSLALLLFLYFRHLKVNVSEGRGVR